MARPRIRYYQITANKYNSRCCTIRPPLRRAIVTVPEPEGLEPDTTAVMEHPPPQITKIIVDGQTLTAPPNIVSPTGPLKKRIRKNLSPTVTAEPDHVDDDSTPTTPRRKKHKQNPSLSRPSRPLQKKKAPPLPVVSPPRKQITREPTAVSLPPQQQQEPPPPPPFAPHTNDVFIPPHTCERGQLISYLYPGKSTQYSTGILHNPQEGIIRFFQPLPESNKKPRYWEVQFWLCRSMFDQGQYRVRTDLTVGASCYDWERKLPCELLQISKTNGSVLVQFQQDDKRWISPDHLVGGYHEREDSNIQPTTPSPPVSPQAPFSPPRNIRTEDRGHHQGATIVSQDSHSDGSSPQHPQEESPAEEDDTTSSPEQDWLKQFDPIADPEPILPNPHTMDSSQDPPHDTPHEFDQLELGHELDQVDKVDEEHASLDPVPRMDHEAHMLVPSSYEGE